VSEHDMSDAAAALNQGRMSDPEGERRVVRTFQPGA
jgi:hypothetical protein